MRKLVINLFLTRRADSLWDQDEEIGVFPMLSKFAKRIVDDQSGATAVEYGLIISLIVLAMVGALGGVADATNEMWGRVSSETTEALNK
jgi:pilus assembly protein Flp/PilA